MSAPINENMECATEKKVELNFVEENGIKVRNDHGKTPSEKAKNYNPKMSICREMTLVTLNTAVKDSSIKLCCVEPLASSGLAALQWKKKLNQNIHVTAAVADQVEILNENCTENDITPKPLQLDFSRIPGAWLPEQNSNEIQTCQCKANVLLHMEAFDFIYLDPHKSCTNYLESVFVNLRHLGILCLVVPDISMFARSHHVVERYYSAAVIKTDYIKELAARVIIGQLARSASRCNKGIEMLYSMSVDDFLLLAVKVHRGPHIADASNQNIRSIIHCRFCEERYILPKLKAPPEDIYSLLPCTCKLEKPGKTAVILGPLCQEEKKSDWTIVSVSKGCRPVDVWTGFTVLKIPGLRRLLSDKAGPIYNPEFLMRMKQNSSILELSKKCYSLLHAMLEEVGCSLATEEDNSECTTENNNGQMKSSESVCEQTKSKVENSETVNLESGKNLDICLGDETAKNCENKKRQLEESEGQTTIKRIKRANLNSSDETDLWSHDFIPFYYNTHRWKLNITKKLPKIAELVELLKSDGYQASKTHFDSKCLRTNATLKQIEQTLNKHCHIKN